mgnify:FL=1
MESEKCNLFIAESKKQWNLLTAINKKAVYLQPIEHFCSVD